MTWGAVATVGLLVGTGVQAYSQYSQAQAQKRVAEYNYAVQQGNARLQMLAQQASLAQQRAQSELALRQAAAQRAATEREAQFRDANARMIRLTADAKASASREDIRRKRLEYARFQAMQRNRIGASGVVASEGSPLELLAETAGQMQLAVQEMHNAANFDFVRANNEAALEDYGAASLRAGASAQFGLERAAAKVREAGFGLNQASINAEYKAGLTDARIQRMVAFNGAKGMEMQAAGTLLSGAGEYGYRRYQTGQYAPAKSTGGYLP